MIPENKKLPVSEALQRAFGLSDFEDICLLTEGLSSALIFRIIIKGKPYLLRVITRTDAMADPSHYFEAMKAGAEAGLGPRVHYAGIEDRISITDFIEKKPFTQQEARTKLAQVLQKLHALPKFPFRIHYPKRMDSIAGQFRASQVLPESLLKDIFETHAKIRNVYPDDTSDWVSCHNDLKPENIIFDGQKPWLVDWEGAFLNDRYTDLVVVANFITNNEEEKNSFLNEYFGSPATDYQLARFALMQQMVHLYYFAMFTSLSAGGKLFDPDDIARPGFCDFHQLIWSGEIDLKENETKLRYGMVHLDKLQKNMRSNRLSESLRIVSKYRGL